MKPRFSLTSIGLLTCLLLAMQLSGDETSLDTDEQVIFFPTWACAESDAPDAAWNVEIHGQIFEPRGGTTELRQFQKLIGMNDDPRADEAVLFAERARPFLADNERRQRVPIRLNGRVYPLDASQADGHFRSTLRLTAAEMAVASAGGTEVAFAAVTKPRDTRQLTGVARLVRKPKGLHVVSDVDDTIKISNVRDKPELLKNTFCRPFRPVPGMAERYQAWARDGAVFHYVSASPWQLYPPLAEFTRQHGFPGGVLYLKPFRVKDRTVLNLTGPQREYKLATIRPVLQRFSQGRFILVGDSGEQDPEIYGQLAREFPGQVQQIVIRDVTRSEEERYKRAFENVPRELWRVE